MIKNKIITLKKFDYKKAWKDYIPYMILNIMIGGTLFMTAFIPFLNIWCYNLLLESDEHYKDVKYKTFNGKLVKIKR